MSARQIWHRLRDRGAAWDDPNCPPGQFGGPEKEESAACSAVALSDLSDRGKIEIQGRDRLKLLHNLCTQDILKLPPGAGTEAFFLDAKGRIVDYALLFLLGDSVWIEVEPGRAAALIQHLDRYVIREDVQFADRTEELDQLHVLGPNADAVFADLIVPAPGPQIEGPAAEVALIADVACQVRRRRRSIFPGYDVLAPAERSWEIWTAIEAAGANHGAAWIGARAIEALRIDAGLPAYGREITHDNLAQEIGRDHEAISFTKGCYIGQETVARLDAMGHVNKLLRGIQLRGEGPPPIGSTVTSDGKEVGKLTSAARSSRLGAIGLSVLRIACKPGSRVRVGETHEGTVVELPFTKPAGRAAG